MKKHYTFLPENWLCLILFAAIACSISFRVAAQNGPAKQWDKTFGGNNEETSSSFIQTADGGYILGGHSLSGISGDKTQAKIGDHDYWVIKVDASGNKQWDRTLGGYASDFLSTVMQTTDGGYILGGTSLSGIGGDKTEASKGYDDYWIVKLDANGNKLWDKTYGGNFTDNLRIIKQTFDGGFILGGFSESDINGDKTQAQIGMQDYWIVKINANGNKIWDKTFGGTLQNFLFSIQQTSDGGYLLGGYSNSGIGGDKSQATQGNTDFWIIKTDANGNKTWDKSFGGSGFDQLYSAEQTSDGGYILGGHSNSPISGSKSQGNKGLTDFWVVKTDATGNKLWDKTFGGLGDDEFISLQKTTDAGYLLGGNSLSSIGGDKTQSQVGASDYWIVKLDGSGNKQWDKTLGGNGSDGLRSLIQTSDGGYLIGGFSESALSGDKSQASQGQTDFWIVKLAADVTGIKEPEASFSISPNPNQGKFTLQLNNLTAPKAEVIVSDLLGRVVLQQPLNVSNNQLSEELTLPNAKGLYLLQVKAGEQLITRKIVVE